MAEQAGVVGSNGVASKLNYWIEAVYSIKLLGDFRHWCLYIFDRAKEGQVKPFFKLTEIEITSFDSIDVAKEQSL